MYTIKQLTKLGLSIVAIASYLFKFSSLVLQNSKLSSGLFINNFDLAIFANFSFSVKFLLRAGRSSAVSIAFWLRLPEDRYVR